MIRALQLGSRSFPVNLIQGPLAGVSCAPFRRLTWRYSQPAFSCTEMISCKTILHQPKMMLQRFISKAPDEGPVCFQLSANNPAELGEATKYITQCGADLIDLNCGCPVKKIRHKGAGSRLLTNPQMLYQLISAMKKNTHLPISIKIRVEGGSDEKFNQDIVTVISDAGADFLVVHGRHWTEHYETPCQLEQIQFFVEQLSIPVIGNGDVACLTSLKKMLATGCAGVMISRAGVGQPWLIGKLLAEMRKEKFILPSSKEIGFIFLEHITQLIELIYSEKFSILQARKFAKYYARHLENKNDFINTMNYCNTIADLKKIIENFF